MFVSQINSFYQDVEKEINKKENLLKNLNGTSKEKRELQEEVAYLKKFASQLENICVFANIAKDNIRSHVYNALYEKETYNQYKKMYQSMNNQLIKVLDLKDSVLGDKKEDEVKRELQFYSDEIARIKSYYLNNGFHLNEKGEKIPTIDYEDKSWDGKKVHLYKLRGLSKEEIDLKVRHVSRVVKIGEFMDRYPSELSGGQQQRVAIARTLAPGPKVLFMDEPLSNLDAKLRLEMRSELKRLHLETGSTFVYVTHDQLEAMTLATKICLINNGVLQQYDAPLDVYKKPKNIFVADFVGSPAINFVEAFVEQGEDKRIKLHLLNNLHFEFNPLIDVDLKALREERDLEFAKEEEERAKLKENKKFVEKGNKDKDFNFSIQKVTETMSSDEERVIQDNEYIIGIRPEFIRLSDEGKIEGEIYSALPSGMETIVKIRVGEFLLTSVIFGGVDYKVGSICRFDFVGKEILLFDRKSGKLISQGGLE